MHTITKEIVMDYTASLIWLAVWPVVLYLGYKLSFKNALKETK